MPHVQRADVVIAGILKIGTAEHKALVAHGGDGGIGHGGRQLVLHYVHSSAGVVLEVDEHNVVEVRLFVASVASVASRVVEW